MKRFDPDVSGATFDDIAQSLASRCGAHRARIDPVNGGRPQLQIGEKQVVNVDLPALTGEGSLRKTAMAGHGMCITSYSSILCLHCTNFPESLLSSTLASLSEVFPDYLVVYTSSSLASRQLPSAPDPRPYVIANDTLPEGGILKRYQLLTPGLIMSLLVAFFLLVPGVLAGVSALASIRSPLRMEAPKAFNAQDRKNQ